MSDLVLRNATIVDGTGSSPTKGDIAIHRGRIAAMGNVARGNGREIDVAGSCVSPGFIDVHTHYDAQAFWDPLLSPSVFHGVTTAIAGNCGFTLAPLSGRDEDWQYLVRMLSRVEGMSLPTLQSAITPTWRSFGDYLDRLSGQLAINTAFLVGHSALRRAVMSDRAVGHEATPGEIDAMCALLAQSLEQGGCGFSTTISYTHLDYEGMAVPSRWASRDEMFALARTVSAYPGTWLEMVHGKSILDEEDKLFMTEMSKAAGRPLNWNLVSVNAADPATLDSQLSASDHARAHGGEVLGLAPAVPIEMVLNFVSGFLLETIPNWQECLLSRPIEARPALLKDESVREILRAGVRSSENKLRTLRDFTDARVATVSLDRNKPLIGRTLGSIGAETGADPLDVLFDLAAEENLEMSFSTAPLGDDDETWKLRAKVWQDSRCLVGGSDAGAHLDMINTFAFSTQLLGAARDRNLLSLEEAVRLITSVPAQKFGLKDRGVLKTGAIADLVVFDPDRIACAPIELRNDLPESGLRLYAKAIGVEKVIVGGKIVAEDGEATGELGGTVLRSGRDTETVSLNPVCA